MAFADNPHLPFTPASRVWEDTNKVVKPAAPTLTDDALFDLVMAATATHQLVGPSNPANPANPNSPLNAQWLASPANPKNAAHASWLASRPTKKDK